MENIFGTDGIRATIGQEPFTIQGLTKLGDAIGRWIYQKYGRNSLILLAHDTRLSSAFVKSTLKSRLVLYPLKIYDAQILTSPAVFQLMQQDTRFCSGIIISASHNPFRDNGIKIVDMHGKLSLEDELMISQFFYEDTKEHTYDCLGVECFWQQAQKKYSSYIEEFFESNFLKNKKIVLDCANGAAYHLAPSLFKKFGAKVIVIHDQPNGININKQCGTLYTESLQKAVVDNQADAGFAFDGDADRVIAVNRLGQLKNGDDILALLLNNKAYENAEKVVGTFMTNKGFELYLEQHNKHLVRTNIGDKYVSAAMQEQNIPLGGEPSGHIIASDYLATGDGIFIALRVLQTLNQTNNWNMDTFFKFPQVQINVPVMQRKNLDMAPIRDIIQNAEKLLHEGRLLVRYSGTEPLLRIMIEDDDYEHAQSIGYTLSKKLQQLLSECL